MVELNYIIFGLYVIVLALFFLQQRRCKRAETIAWIAVCVNGIGFVIARLLSVEPIDVLALNIWSAVIRIHTIVTLIVIEGFRYARMRTGGYEC